MFNVLKDKNYDIKTLKIQTLTINSKACDPDEAITLALDWRRFMHVGKTFSNNGNNFVPSCSAR